MKSKVTLINIISSLTLQVVTVISGFIIPKIILTNFGSSVNGLVSSLNQFLSYITLIEGGITGVVLANLYKPLVDHDDKKISAVLVTAKKFFNKIGYLFIAYSMGVAVVYPILSKEGFSWPFVASLTVVLSLNLLIQYLFSLSFRVLLQADKKLYVISFTQIVITVCNIVCAFLSVKIYPSIHLLKLLTGLLFSREQCDTKITELLDLFGLSDRMLVTEAEKKNMSEINYEEVHSRIAEARKESLEFLNMELTSCV